MTLVKKVLIANRGEIALRIIRACRLLHLKTVAVYATADKFALHVGLADEAVCIGSASPEASYLNQRNIVAAALGTHCDAVHPGYGFLSENASFAKLCADNQLKFIGPSAKVIALMGEKAQARATMVAAGVPVAPGSDGDFTAMPVGQTWAAKIGYPVMLKASAGGGGKGMRVITNAADFPEAFNLAQGEAQNAFGDGHMYLEKYLTHPRHIEVQILADQAGHTIAVGDRDCTIQHHHQKVLEEAPAVIVDEPTRGKMHQVAVQAAASIGYEGAGTVEFLYDGPNQFYFMEMNTRIQVEHPVTELTSHTDLVAAQLEIAQGLPLMLTTPKAPANFALECRITANTAGTITALHLPDGHGIRTDTALYQGYQVPPYYDAMIAKIIAYGPDRPTVIRQMQSAIDETVIAGISTNLDFLMQLLQEPKFLDNTTDINWVDHLVQPAPMA
jgi:acetyl-CoA carboxylase biotin carboxylase subunit